MKQKLIFALCGALIGAATVGFALNSAVTEQVELERDSATARYEQYEERIAYLEERLVDSCTVRFYDIPMSTGLQAYTYAMCEKYGIPEYYELVLAVIERESNFDPQVVSNTNDYGLMQINRCNFDWLSTELGIVDFLDPYNNINAGTYILSGYIKKYDTVAQALMVYNMGAAGAQRAWNNGRTSSSYSEYILERYNIYIN